MAGDQKGFDPRYDDTKETDTIIVGKSMTNHDGSTYRKVELLLDEDVGYVSDKNKTTADKPIDFTVCDRTVLWETDGGQQKIQCWLTEADQGQGKFIQALHISRRTRKGVFGSQEVTLTFKSICALYEYLNRLFSYDTPAKIKVPIEYSQYAEKTGAQRLVSESEFIELIRANISSTDDFYKLIRIQKMELAVKQLAEIISGAYRNEVSIQDFLKENIWMFGNDYVHIIENERINAQNILDMVPQDFESYIDIIEVKLPDEKLFNFDESHNDYYCTSKLTKAIAQTQNYIFELENVSQDGEYQQKNNCRIVRPKGIILFGSGDPLGDDEKQYLRILNSSYHNLQIITYQQLLEKAQNTLKILREKENG